MSVILTLVILWLIQRQIKCIVRIVGVGELKKDKVKGMGG